MSLQDRATPLARAASASARTVCPVDRVQPGGSGPALFLNPADDLTFVAEVERVMEEGVADPLELEQKLRSSYPNVVVRPRGLSNESFVVWYVYRDGHWVASR